MNTAYIKINSDGSVTISPSLLEKHPNIQVSVVDGKLVISGICKADFDLLVQKNIFWSEKNKIDPFGNQVSWEKLETSDAEYFFRKSDYECLSSIGNFIQYYEHKNYQILAPKYETDIYTLLSAIGNPSNIENFSFFSIGVDVSSLLEKYVDGTISIDELTNSFLNEYSANNITGANFDTIKSAIQSIPLTDFKKYLQPIDELDILKRITNGGNNTVTYAIINSKTSIIAECYSHGMSVKKNNKLWFSSVDTIPKKYSEHTDDDFKYVIDEVKEKNYYFDFLIDDNSSFYVDSRTTRFGAEHPIYYYQKIIGLTNANESNFNSVVDIVSEVMQKTAVDYTKYVSSLISITVGLPDSWSSEGDFLNYNKSAYLFFYSSSDTNYKLTINDISIKCGYELYGLLFLSLYKKLLDSGDCVKSLLTFKGCSIVEFLKSKKKEDLLRLIFSYECDYLSQYDISYLLSVGVQKVISNGKQYDLTQAQPYKFEDSHFDWARQDGVTLTLEQMKMLYDMGATSPFNPDTSTDKYECAEYGAIINPERLYTQSEIKRFMFGHAYISSFFSMAERLILINNVPMSSAQFEIALINDNVSLSKLLPIRDSDFNTIKTIVDIGVRAYNDLFISEFNAKNAINMENDYLFVDTAVKVIEGLYGELLDKNSIDGKYTINRTTISIDGSNISISTDKSAGTGIEINEFASSFRQYPIYCIKEIEDAPCVQPSQDKHNLGDYIDIDTTPTVSIRVGEDDGELCIVGFSTQPSGLDERIWFYNDTGLDFVVGTQATEESGTLPKYGKNTNNEDISIGYLSRPMYLKRQTKNGIVDVSFLGATGETTLDPKPYCKLILTSLCEKTDTTKTWNVSAEVHINHDGSRDWANFKVTFDLFSYKLSVSEYTITSNPEVQDKMPTVEATRGYNGSGEYYVRYLVSGDEENGIEITYKAYDPKGNEITDNFRTLTIGDLLYDRTLGDL